MIARMFMPIPSATGPIMIKSGAPATCGAVNRLSFGLSEKVANVHTPIDKAVLGTSTRAEDEVEVLSDKLEHP